MIKCRKCGESEDIMNVKELFAKVNTAELAKELEWYCKADIVEDMLSEFESTQPHISDRVLISSDTIRNTRLEACAPVELVRWEDILGTEISEKCFEDCTEIELATSLFTEMTEHGFDSQGRSEEIARILEGGSLVI